MRIRRSVNQYMLTEAGLGKGVFINKDPKRLSNFLKKWKNGEPFEKIDGEEVILSKPSRDFQDDEYWQLRDGDTKTNMEWERKLYLHLTGKLEGVSGFKSVPHNIPTDKGTIKLGELLKTAEFGGQGAAKGPSGEDWEAMIAVGLEFRQNKDPLKTLPDEWNRIEKFWIDDYYREQAIKLAEAFDNKGYSPMKQTGSGKGGAGVSNTWKGLYQKHGGKGKMNKTPKTDVIGGGVKLSLKKVGGSQVMSSKRQESFATFEAAMLLYGEEYPSDVTSILNDFKDDVLDLEDSGYKGSIENLEKDIEKSKGNRKEMEKLQSFKDNLDLVRKNGEKLTLKINKLFRDDPRMKQMFIFEAASGKTKFGDDSVSRADRMVEFDPIKGIITTDWSIKNARDIESIMAKYKFYMSFKSSGSSTPYMSLRGNLMSPAGVQKYVKSLLGESVEYREDCPTFSTIMEEAFNQNLYGRTLMLEEFENLNEFQIFGKLKSKISDLKSKVLNTGVGKKFLQIWGWIKQRVSMAFDWIIKQGKKALGYFLKFFGLKPKEVGVRGPIEFFSK